MAIPSVGWIGIEIAADKAKLGDTAFEFGGGRTQIGLRRLRQLAYPGKIARIEVNEALDDVVGFARPSNIGGNVTLMRGHHRGTRQEDGHIRAALLQQFQLIGFNALAQLIVRNHHARRLSPNRLAAETAGFVEVIGGAALTGSVANAACLVCNDALFMQGQVQGRLWRRAFIGLCTRWFDVPIRIFTMTSIHIPSRLFLQSLQWIE